MLDDAKKQAVRQDEALMRRVLAEHNVQLRGNRCRCLFHDDTHPSASIYTSKKDGSIRYGCRVCNLTLDIFALRARLENRTDAEVMKEMLGGGNNGKARPKREELPVHPTMEALKQSIPDPVVAVFDYPLADGTVYMSTIRVQPKGRRKYFQGVRPVDGGLITEFPTRPPLWPLYNLPSVLSVVTVVLVEGEGKVDALAEYGLTGTTSACGCGSAANTNWQPLAGKNIIVWPDNDDAGTKYGREVVGILEGLHPAPRVAIIDPAVLGLGHKEDVVDFIRVHKDAGANNEDILRKLVEALDTAKTKSAIAELDERHEAIISGAYRCIAWPWPALSDAARAVLPGAIVVLAGTVGASKSFMTMQAMLFWLAMGINVVLYALERRKPDHLQRALAQLSGNANHTRDEWVATHPDEVARDKRQHRAQLENFAHHLRTTDSLGAETLDQIADWVATEAKAGRRIVIVDPVTAATRVGKPWEADQRFLRSVEKSANDHGCSVILVSHPAKGTAEPTRENLAGGACYERFSSVILTLHSHDDKTDRVKQDLGTLDETYNRTLRIEKASHSWGAGSKLAYRFDKESLTLSELGVIVKKAKP